MRNKQKGIYIRVDNNEKIELIRKAKKCKLSLSAYLRKSGLDKKLIEVPNEKFKKIYEYINELILNSYRFNKEEIIIQLGNVLESFRNIYFGDDENGNNENMGN